jgi:hypothetical protein
VWFDELDARAWRWREVEGPEGFARYEQAAEASRFLARTATISEE